MYQNQTNLIEPNQRYLHPLTKKVDQVFNAIFDSLGNRTNNTAVIMQVSYKTMLTPEEIVTFYYQLVDMPNSQYNMTRDAGSVKYLVKKMGLDMALFCIEALATEYLDGPDRLSSPAPLIKASEMIEYGTVRIGQAREVAIQYGLT